MEERVPLPRPAKDFNTAKRMHMEQFGSALVTNNYLKVALAGVSLVAVGLIVLNIKTYQTFENFKPLVIRISDIGRAEALSYDSFQYAPQDAEIRYFLIQFVTKHYSRRRATIREAYAESLYFLDGPLADAAIASRWLMAQGAQASSVLTTVVSFRVKCQIFVGVRCQTRKSARFPNAAAIVSREPKHESDQRSLG